MLLSYQPSSLQSRTLKAFFSMIVPSPFSSFSLPAPGASSYLSMPTTGNQSGDTNSRPDSFSQTAIKTDKAHTYSQETDPVDLPDLGHALKSLYTGRIRHDMSTFPLGEKLFRDTSLRAERVLHFTFNQQKQHHHEA